MPCAGQPVVGRSVPSGVIARRAAAATELRRPAACPARGAPDAGERRRPRDVPADAVGSPA